MADERAPEHGGSRPSCNDCGAWWLPGGKRCDAHKDDPIVPMHSVSETRKTFPALSEEVRRWYRVNGNLSQDVPDGPPVPVPAELTRERRGEPRPTKRFR